MTGKFSRLGADWKRLLLTIPAVVSVLSFPSCDSTTSPETGERIYTSQNLRNHTLAAECNPGGATQCECSDTDVDLVLSPTHGEVISNVRGRRTFVNAIAYRQFRDNFPGGEDVSLKAYRYAGEFQLRGVPRPDARQRDNPEAIHMMIQLWDGSSKLFKSDDHTLEGTIYYDLNPWSPDYGKIKVYRYPIDLVETGISLTPDTAWHTFALEVDLSKRRYVSVAVDARAVDLTRVELARVHQPTWGPEVALNITTESLASWPQRTCELVFSWGTRFRDLIFEYR